MFDLEKSIAAWRQQYQHRDTISTDDLAELEQHLRDEISELVATGLSQQTAFLQAARDMGDFNTAEIEYGKVFWSKAKREQRLRDAISTRLSMFGSYFRIAIRSMIKQKVYASINIFGLAAGLACFILIFLFVQFEFSYDRFYEDVDEIYRVTKRNPGDVYLGTDHFALTQPPLASTIESEFQEIESATSFAYLESLINTNGHTVWEKGLQADPSFFRVFGLSLAQGDTATALSNPFSIILTQSLAIKIFGNQDPMGKVLTLDQNSQYQVTGVISNPPSNSTIQYQFLASVLSDDYYQQQIAENRWNSNYMYTFLRLREDANIASIESKMPVLVDKYLYPEQPGIPEADKESFYFQALGDVHLNSTANFDLGRHGNKTQVFMMIVIAIIILLLACINYINLAIARSLKRSQEVGLRKTIGAVKPQLFRQFIGESLVITITGMILALGIAYLCLPFFSDIVMRDLSFSSLFSRSFILGLCTLTIFTAGISGFYPASLMASLNPIDALKKRITNVHSRFNFQHILIVTQFTASIVLITCGYIIYHQLDFVRTKEMGYNRSHIVNVDIHDNNQELKENIAIVKSSIQQNAGIVDVSASHALPSNVTMQQTIFGWQGAAEDDRLYLHVNAIDYNFLSLYGIELVSGRSFSTDFPSDAQTACIINQTTARLLGWSPDEAIGQSFMHDDVLRTVIGVAKDFHLHSVHHAIKPLLLFIDDGGRFDYLSIKVAPGSLPQSLDGIEAIVQEASSFPFEYAFLDDQFDQLYASEEKLASTLGFFTIIAFLIASLGLFGLAAFSAEQRNKEIGVRKILGASSGRIAWMLSKEFSVLVLFSSLIATPIAYIVSTKWLQIFAYRVELTPFIFLTTALVALLIAQLAVGYQAFRAAWINPIHILRD